MQRIHGDISLLVYFPLYSMNIEMGTDVKAVRNMVALESPESDFLPTNNVDDAINMNSNYELSDQYKYNPHNIKTCFLWIESQLLAFYFTLPNRFKYYIPGKGNYRTVEPYARTLFQVIKDYSCPAANDLTEQSQNIHNTKSGIPAGTNYIAEINTNIVRGGNKTCEFWY